VLLLPRRHFRKSRSLITGCQLVGMVPRDEYRLVIHNSVRLGYAPWLRGGFRDELVTQSLTTGTIVAASAFDEVTEFGYFEYCGLGSK
jgi:hypothetical protein